MLKLDKGKELARAVDVMMAQAKRIYVFGNQSYQFVSLFCPCVFRKE